jgi:hypothetical protein
LFDQEHPGHPDQRGVVGVDADHLRAAADLAVDPLERVCGSGLWPVFFRERVEAEQLVLGGFEQPSEFGAGALSRSTTSVSRSCASWPESARKIWRIAAAIIGC